MRDYAHPEDEWVVDRPRTEQDKLALYQRRQARHALGQKKREALARKKAREKAKAEKALADWKEANARCGNCKHFDSPMAPDGSRVPEPGHAYQCRASTGIAPPRLPVCVTMTVERRDVTSDDGAGCVRWALLVPRPINPKPSATNPAETKKLAVAVRALT